MTPTVSELEATAAAAFVEADKANIHPEDYAPFLEAVKAYWLAHDTDQGKDEAALFAADLVRVAGPGHVPRPFPRRVPPTPDRLAERSEWGPAWEPVCDCCNAEIMTWPASVFRDCLHCPECWQHQQDHGPMPPIKLGLIRMGVDFLDLT